MGMTRGQKTDEVAELSALLDGAQLVVLTHYAGLNVAKVTALRGAARAGGSRFKVTKNTLARRAVANTDFAPLAEKFTGPTGIVVSADPVAAARVAHDFAKEHEALIILGGALGAQILDAKGVEALAKLPGLDELRATLLGVLQAPMAKLVGTLTAPGRDLACVMKAYTEKGD